MHAKYKVSISYGSTLWPRLKFFATDRHTYRQSDTQKDKKKLDAPKFHHGGIKMSQNKSSSQISCVSSITLLIYKLHYTHVIIHVSYIQVFYDVLLAITPINNPFLNHRHTIVITNNFSSDPSHYNHCQE